VKRSLLPLSWLLLVCGGAAVAGPGLSSDPKMSPLWGVGGGAIWTVGTVLYLFAGGGKPQRSPAPIVTSAKAHTSPVAWAVLSTWVILYWAAAIAVVVIGNVYGGRHPEALHGFMSAVALLLFWTSLPLALIHSAAVRRAESRHEALPSHVRRSRTAIWSLAALVGFLFLMTLFTNLAATI
jgi:hypothetical protein